MNTTQETSLNKLKTEYHLPTYKGSVVLGIEQSIIHNYYDLYLTNDIQIPLNEKDITKIIYDFRNNKGSGYVFRITKLNDE